MGVRFSPWDLCFGGLTPLNSKFVSDHGSHPLVQDITQKSEMFDQYAAHYAVPPQVTLSA